MTALLWLPVLAVGAYLVAVVDGRMLSTSRGTGAWINPLRRLAWLLGQQQIRTERPDFAAWKLAPAAYLGLALCALSVVPLAPDLLLADTRVGIVLWGAVESLTVVAVFLHGWSANSALALVAGYRYVAIGLCSMLLSMFVLIAAALPAESLSLVAVVESQRALWNIVRQPLGLPLFMVLGWAISLRGPLDFADSASLSGGTLAEVSSASRLVWETARAAMLVAFSAMGATVFLGGYLGPWLPGPAWMILKTLALLGVAAWGSHRVARVGPSRMLTLLWVVLLPISFLHLLIAGLVALA